MGQPRQAERASRSRGWGPVLWERGGGDCFTVGGTVARHRAVRIRQRSGCSPPRRRGLTGSRRVAPLGSGFRASSWLRGIRRPAARTRCRSCWRRTPRLASLVPIRMARMSISPWTFYRGAAAVMAADLAGSAHTGLDVQLCGDAHVLNFGLWATPERQLSFDLRDFDPKPRAVPSNGTSSGISRVWWCWPVTTACPSPPHAPSGRRPGCAHIVGRMVGTTRRPESARRSVVRLGHGGTAPCCSRCSNPRSGNGSARLDKRAKRRTSAGAARKLTRLVDGRLANRRGPTDPGSPAGRGFRGACGTDRSSKAYHDSLPYDRRYLLDKFTSSTWFGRSSGWAASVCRSTWCRRRAAARRSAVPADQAGRTVGVRALPRAESLIPTMGNG